MPTLPTEMIYDVLSRLPVKSLLRFRCTSKPVCSMIHGPYFTKLRLNRSAQNHSKQSLVLTSHQLYSIDLSSLERAVEIEHPLKTPLGHTEVLGSCNGLLCLYNLGSEVVLWNMSTRKHHRLPYIHMILYHIAYGFGYDSVHDDYKLVRIFRLQDLEVVIYRLKSNSWERVAFHYDLPSYPSMGMGVFADGALHWLIEHDNIISILAFDLATEEFWQVPQPPVAPNGNFLVQMSAWEGRLCVICNFVGKGVDLWVLKHNKGLRELSWEKLLSISDPQLTTSSHCIVPMAYLNNGNELVLLHDYNKFFCYDLKRKEVQNVVIQGMPHLFDAMLYVESLVKPFPMVNGDDETLGNQQKSHREG